MAEQITNHKSLTTGRYLRAAEPGVVYFLVVFAVGWILGPIRTLWAVPRFGALAGALMEAPLMLISMLVAAKWAVRRFAVNSINAVIVMGAIAFGLLIPAEIGGLWLRRLTLHEYLEGLISPPGIVSLALFLLFGAMPLLTVRARWREAIAPETARRRSR
jgi:hypothetical protein